MTPEQIKQARRKLGLTQSKLADMLGYGAPARVAEIESGARTPGDAVVRLLRAYVDGYRPSDWPVK